MLKINKLNLKYGKNHVLRDLDLELETGRVHGLVGLNGSGKTSLLNILYGLLQADSGQILLDEKQPPANFFAYLETENFFYSRMTVREYLALFRLKNPVYDTEARRLAFHLPAERYAEELSAGMKKKLALTGVLALDRPFYILDEPANGLDLEANRQLKKIVREMKTAGKTVVITSHVFEVLTGICDTIHYLKEGRIAGSWLPETFGEIERAVFGEEEV